MLNFVNALRQLALKSDLIAFAVAHSNINAARTTARSDLPEFNIVKVSTSHLNTPNMLLISG
jgi:hypothetical protein